MYLRMEKINKAYDGRPAISDIDMDLERGKLLCLLGPSGCGKSTILKAVGGFLKVDSGRIFLDDIDITQLPPEQRDVSTVFQSYGLFAHMNVIDNITYGLKFRGLNKRQRLDSAMDMMDKVGLTGYEKKSVSQLSGGEQQRVALARSLVVRPKLLLLDEPLSNLDAKLRITMREEIKRIQREFDITTVFVTHDQAEAFEIGDKIVLLNRGRIVQTATPRELYDVPEDEFALHFIGESNLLPGGYVRPERIRISKQGKEALIAKIVFKGDQLDLLLETEDGLLRATELNRGQDYREGDRVYIDYEKKRLSSDKKVR